MGKGKGMRSEDSGRGHLLALCALLSALSAPLIVGIRALFDLIYLYATCSRRIAWVRARTIGSFSELQPGFCYFQRAPGWGILTRFPKFIERTLPVLQSVSFRAIGFFRARCVIPVSISQFCLASETAEVEFSNAPGESFQ